MAVSRTADDFAVIRTRLHELHREREQAKHVTDTNTVRERAVRTASDGLRWEWLNEELAVGFLKRAGFEAPSRSVVATASRTQTSDRQGAPGDALSGSGVWVRRAAHRCAARGAATAAGNVDSREQTEKHSLLAPLATGKIALRPQAPSRVAFFSIFWLMF
jgi:hypothetical protein